MQQPGEENKQQKAAFADSDAAVFDLLEALLQEVDEFPADLETKPVEKVETEVRTEAQPQVQTAVKIIEPEPLDTVIQAEALQTGEQTEDTLPEWTGDPQQCLLFEVEGTEVAIPLIVLNSIAVWDQEALPIPTQPDWHLGVIKHRDANVVILDTARLIMPEKLTQTSEERRVQHGSHFLVINHRWALSCDGIKETILLTPDQVKWRPQRPTRPWAVGTLIDRLCVLLDTEALIQEIEQD